MKLTLVFAFERETKGSVRYQEVDPSGAPVSTDYKVGTLYLRKTALAGASIPPKLFVEITS